MLLVNRVVAIGHSSGGHLALWLAGRAKLPQTSELYMKNPLQLKGVVDLDGPGDLKATLPMQQSVCGAPVITQLLGGTPAERPERYRETSPIEMVPLGFDKSFSRAGCSRHKLRSTKRRPSVPATLCGPWC